MSPSSARASTAARPMAWEIGIPIVRQTARSARRVPTITARPRASPAGTRAARERARSMQTPSSTAPTGTAA